jgi:hypothetical protein
MRSRSCALERAAGERVDWRQARLVCRQSRSRLAGLRIAGGSAEQDTHGGAATKRRGLSMRRLSPAVRRGMEQAGGRKWNRRGAGMEQAGGRFDSLLKPVSKRAGAPGRAGETAPCRHSRAPSMTFRARSRAPGPVKPGRQPFRTRHRLTLMAVMALTASDGKPHTDPGRSRPGRSGSRAGCAPRPPPQVPPC